MKLKNLVLAFIFIFSAAAVNASAQSEVTGTITGRVVSANGSAVRRASVIVLNLITLESQSRVTNDFGYFRFTNLPIINLYLVQVASKNHTFSLSNQLVEFTELEHHITFTANN